MYDKEENWAIEARIANDQHSLYVCDNPRMLIFCVWFLICGRWNLTFYRISHRDRIAALILYKHNGKTKTVVKMRVTRQPPLVLYIIEQAPAHHNQRVPKVRGL